MFLGHYGVALALKRAEPKVSLGVLFVAVQLVDILWGAFVLRGWERMRIVPGLTAVNPLEFTYYPITHSLLGTVCWALAAAAVYYSWPTRDTGRHARASAVVGLAVLSHWPLDLLVHLPDLPLASDASAKLGLGLWRSVPATLVLELAMLAAGVVLYAGLRTKKRRPRAGRLAVVVVVLVAVYLASLFGPEPPSAEVVAASALVGGLLAAALGAWAGVPAPPPPPPALRRRG